MSYTFNRDGVLEEVELEEWRWEAYYKDGEILKQFADDFSFHQFSEIEQDRLGIFVMTDGNKTFSLVFPDNSKLIHFYRNMLLENSSVRVRLYVFGYQDSGGTKLFAIMPDGNLVITDDMEKVQVVSEMDSSSQ